MEGKFAVVTGSSQGLGKSFAIQLAKDGWNLILISLPGENLRNLSNSLNNSFGIRAFHYETDLTIQENVMAVSDWINQNFNIQMLVNNAGIGGTNRFDEASSAYIEKIIQLISWFLLKVLPIWIRLPMLSNKIEKELVHQFNLKP